MRINKLRRYFICIKISKERRLKFHYNLTNNYNISNSTFLNYFNF